MKNLIKAFSVILIFALLSMGLAACTQPDEPEKEDNSDQIVEEKPDDNGGSTEEEKPEGGENNDTQTHIHTAGTPRQENVISATCYSDGSYDSVVYCSECGEQMSRENVTVSCSTVAHTPADAVEENHVAPTCKENGGYESVVYCAEPACHKEILRDYISIDKSTVPHTLLEPKQENYVAPTCKDDGKYIEVVYCSVCNEICSSNYITLPATGKHEFVDGVCVGCEGLESTATGIQYELNPDGKSYTLVSSEGFTGTEVVVDFYKGLPVTAIEASAFYNKTKLVSLTVGKSVKSIGSNAFYKCTALTTVTLNEGLEYIYESAFELSEKITFVAFPASLKVIYKRAFYDCYALSFSFAENCQISEIGAYAFYYTKSENMIIPKQVVTIGNYAFSKCTLNSTVEFEERELTLVLGTGCFDESAVKTVSIPKEVEVIPDRAFRMCKISSLYIENGVKEIGKLAFYYNSNLTTVRIPDSVTTIGESAFEQCVRLSSVVIGAGVTYIGGNAFKRVNSVNDLTSLQFKNPTGWYYNGNLIPEETLSSPSAAASYYNDHTSIWTRVDDTEN